ncbi:MAG: hypothetical protein ABF289_18205 [Clostridiales bacterium]
MADFRKFVPVTFSNGGVPAINDINLNAIEDLLEITDEELGRSQAVSFSDYIEYFQSRNSKIIDLFSDSSLWTAAASTTLSDDTTNNPIGEASVKMAESDNVAGWMGMYKTISALDLTLFENGEDASTTSDIVMLYFYISDIAKFTYFDLRLGQDASNYYAIAYNPAALRNGWNAVYAAKSSFTSVGVPPAWSNITYIRVNAQSVINAINEYFSVQLCYLYRQDPVYSGYYNPFQLYKGSVTGWENVFTILSDAVGLYRDNAIERVGLMKLDQYSYVNSSRSLLIYEDISNFISKFEIYCKADGEGPSITWRIDASNYIEIYVASDTLYIYEYKAAAGTTVSKALNNALKKQERYLLYIEKNNDTMRVIMNKGNEAPSILEFETTLSSAGSIYIGWNGTTGFGLITDFIISNTQIMKLKESNTPLYISKGLLEVVNNSNVLINDAEIWANLEGNRLYHIQAFLAVSNVVSATPDVKTAWSLTNGDFRTSRNLLGPDTATTDLDNTDVKMKNENYSTAVAFGTETAKVTFIWETFMIEIYENGGKLQLQWAQNIAHPSDTTMLGRSYIVITPVVKSR